MLNYKEIMNYCYNYKINNGIVFEKKTKQQVIDEETILKVKTAILIFKEAQEAYHSDIQQFGKTSKSKEDYIKKTMEKFGVNNEKNSFGINKLVNAILTSNGHYEEFMSGNELQNSKFSIFVGLKKEYGIAYLRLKFREKGLDIQNLKISQDLSELQHNGVSKVIIDFKVKKYEKQYKKTNDVEKSNLQHPRANELNELEKQKQIAKQNNDEIAYNYAQNSIEKIIRESRLEVSPKQWDSMSIQDKITFVKIKINEAKILHNQSDFNYWNSNLKSLNEKIISQSETREYNQPSYNNESIKDYQKVEQNETTNNNAKLISQLRIKLSQVQNTYHDMLADECIDEEELATLLEMVNKIINDGYSLKPLITNQNDLRVLSVIIDSLEEEKNKMNKIQREKEEIGMLMN